jgi:DNA topoisomerase-1
VITAQLDTKVVRNLHELAKTKGEPLFNGVNSGLVGDFLKEVMEGLSAKVFRTCYATEAVEGKLREIYCDSKSPDYLKRHIATKANLEAAIVCNHKRTIPKTWGDSLQKKKIRLKELQEKERSDEKLFRVKIREEDEMYRIKTVEVEKRLSEAELKLEEMKKIMEEEKDEKKKISLKKRNASIRDTVKVQREKMRKLKNTHLTTVEKLKSQLNERRRRNLEAIDKMRFQVESQEMTKDYNLGTSLKNYVDPRVFYDWGRKVGYDWKEYYPATLQQKFSWLDKDEEEEAEDEE